MDKFLEAVYLQDISLMKELIRLGFDINSKDLDGRNALMHAVLDNESSVQIVEFLVKNGCNLDCQDTGQKWSALHFAARDQKSQIVTKLLDLGATPDLTDVFGNTPLWRAVMSYSGDKSVIQKLINSGAAPNLKNTNGVSPFSLAETLDKLDLVDLFSDK